MSDRTMEVLPLPRCCSTLRGLRLGTQIPNKCTLQVDHGQDGEAILHYVSKQLGHSSIKITVDYYGHLVPTRRRVIVNRLDDGPPRPAQSATNPQQPAEGDPILEDAT